MMRKCIQKKIHFSARVRWIALSLLLTLVACQQDKTALAKEITSKSGSKHELRARLSELLKIDGREDDSLWVEFDTPKEHDTYFASRLRFNSNGETVPGHLLLPKKGSKPHPVMICLQGHAPGMFISLGEFRNESEKGLVQGGRDLAIQAIDNGWAALVIEQKGFGERQRDSMTCNHQSLQELMHGRTMIGERVYDIMRTIDVINTLDDLHHNKIGIIGNSSGGTTAYYAAAMDPRINLAIVSCSFSTLETSWLKYPHCSCGYIPDLLKTADMPDLARLIAPRELIIVAGSSDYLADIEGVHEGFATASTFYQEENVEDKLQLIVGEGGHQFYPEQTWPVITDILSSWDENGSAE